MFHRNCTHYLSPKSLLHCDRGGRTRLVIIIIIILFVHYFILLFSEVIHSSYVIISLSYVIISELRFGLLENY